MRSSTHTADLAGTVVDERAMPSISYACVAPEMGRRKPMVVN
jgi:hypothetical protein